MSLSTNPMRVAKGCWVLDYHTVASVYLGDDEYGNPVFHTQRTEVGEYLYRLKYRPRAVDDKMINEMVETIGSFIRSELPEMDLIVPIPPSQPRPTLHKLLECLSEYLRLPVDFESVARNREVPPIKNIYDYGERVNLLEDAHRVDPNGIAGRSVLLFDDLYRSGATMNSVAEALYRQGNARAVRGLAITRTRSNR